MKKKQADKKPQIAYRPQSTEVKTTVGVKEPPFIPLFNTLGFRTRKELIAALLIGVLTFLVYLPALQNGFVNWDDPGYVYENPNIHTLSFDFFRWLLAAVVVGNWHPLTMLSLAVDYFIWGLNPFGYHLTNIIFHTLNTFLVFVLAHQLIECGSPQKTKLETPNFSLIAAGVTALLFGIHPLHVESVAWISERKDALYAFFYLLSLLAYVNYSMSKKFKSYVFSLAFFILSLMSKPMAISLPAVLLIIDYYPFKRLRFDKLDGVRKVFVEKTPFFLLSILSAIVTISAQHSGGALVSTTSSPLVMRFAVASWGYLFYLTKLIFPLHLVPHYPYPKFIILLSIEYLFPMIVFTAATVLALKTIKRNNFFSAAWLYYTITLLPVIGLFQIGNFAAADRYMYLPSIGPLLIIGYGVWYLFTKFSEKRIYRAITLLILITISGILAATTVRQIGIWRNSITLWTHTVKILPDVSYTAYLNRGTAYYDSGNTLKAIKDFDMAIKLNPEYAEAYNHRGASYFKLGDIEKALTDINKAVDLKPEFVDAHKNLGILYTELGRHLDAVESFSMALKINPNDSDAYNRLGNNLKNLEAVLENYNTLIAQNPLSEKAYNERGNIYTKLGKIENAIRDFDMAVKINPRFAKAYNNRGTVFLGSGDYEKATKDFYRAIEINSQYSAPYHNLGILFSEAGDTAKGAAYLKKAEELRHFEIDNK